MARRMSPAVILIDERGAYHSLVLGCVGHDVAEA